MTILGRDAEPSGTLVRLRDEDPALFEGVRPEARRDAGARVTAPAHALGRGAWDGALGPAPPGGIGLLVLDGLVLRTVSACGRRGSELLGPGDLLRPWDHDGAAASIPFGVDFRVMERARIALLDDRFVQAVRPWPEVLAAIVGRAVQRAHWLALQLTVADMRRVDDRVLAVFWHFADRWGTAGSDGVALPLAISHEVLAQIVSAQRPTVSAALMRLREDGRVRRLPDRTWLLVGGPPASRPLSATG